jgi:hypothetical protein
VDGNQELFEIFKIHVGNFKVHHNLSQFLANFANQLASIANLIIRNDNDNFLAAILVVLVILAINPMAIDLAFDCHSAK